MWLLVAEVGVDTSIGGTVPYICVCPVASWSFVLPPRISLLYALPPPWKHFEWAGGGEFIRKESCFRPFWKRKSSSLPCAARGQDKIATRRARCQMTKRSFRFPTNNEHSSFILYLLVRVLASDHSRNLHSKPSFFYPFSLPIPIRISCVFLLLKRVLHWRMPP